MKALILAAGLGTRLLPLTQTYAKPALPVLGVPTFWYGAWHLRQSLGITEMAINGGHCIDTLKKAIDDPELKKFTGITFKLSDESAQILGSSGALWKLREWVGDSPLLVLNGDVLSPTPWPILLKQHQKAKGLMTLSLRPHKNSVEKYTEVQLDPFRRILGFGEKLNQGTMFSGSYILEAQALKKLPEGKSELMETILRPLSVERNLFGISEETPWLDTGSLKTFFHSNFQLLEQIPSFRMLAEIKLKEIQKNVFVPKSWDEKKLRIKFKGQVQLLGQQDSWLEFFKNQGIQEIGPYFLGLSPPSLSGSFSSSLTNLLSFDSQFIPI